MTEQKIEAQATEQLFAQFADGDRAALDALFPRVYQSLRELAHQQLLRKGGSKTLSTTALVHESYLNLVRNEGKAFETKAHFLACAATAMRNILIDHARRHASVKGGANQIVSLDFSNNDIAVEDLSSALLNLDQALTELATLDRQLVSIVELRFFAGLSVEETADALQLSERSVVRLWAKAKAILSEFLT